MRLTLPVILFALIILLLAGGCTPSGPVDDAVEDALNALILTDEFNEHEQGAVKSISAHNEEVKVWLKTGFSEDSDEIREVAEHVAKVFAEKFYEIAIEKKYMEDKYNIEVWMKVRDDKGTYKALVAEWWWDLQKDRVDGDNYGFARTKDIR